MITWPVDFLRPSQLLWRRALVTDSDTAVNGVEYNSATDGGGAWVCTMTVELKSEDKVRTALALAELADGGLTPFIVPSFDFGTIPYPGRVRPPDVPFSDGASFSDGSRFTSSGIKIVLAADASERATEIIVRPDVASPLRGFEHFGVSHQTQLRRLYAVLLIKDLGGGLQQLTIRPPFREATLALTNGNETELDFGGPSCVMTLSNAKDCVAALTRPVKSTLTLIFKEHDA